MRDGLVDECDKWVEENIPLLNAYASEWTEEDKRRVLIIYYWSEIFIVQTPKFVLEGGAAATTEKDVGFDWDKCKIIKSSSEFHGDIKEDDFSNQFKYNWKKSEYVDDEFLKKVLEISRELNIDPDDLMAIMAFESGGFDPKSKNSDGYVGLIQFGDLALQSIEDKYNVHYTRKDIENMTAIEQLDVVLLHYKWQLTDKNRKYSLSDLYMTVIWPIAIGEKEDYVLFRKGDKYYLKNEGLDINKDGIITKAEATQKVVDKKEEYRFE